MLDDRRRVYLDSSVFLTYIEGVPEERMLILDELFAAAATQRVEIYTSTVTITEVAFAHAERVRRVLDPAVEAAIDQFWTDPSLVNLVDYSAALGTIARGLIRSALVAGRSLKPMDAIHLTTAQQFAVSAFYTYDKRLLGYAPNLGFAITEPTVGSSEA